jgi:hypothetical protein
MMRTTKSPASKGKADLQRERILTMALSVTD